MFLKRAVLERFEKVNVNVRQMKCQLLANKIAYICHEISPQDIQNLPNKHKPILECLAPTNTQQLKSFLCMVTFYDKHIPLVSAKLPNLYDL